MDDLKLREIAEELWKRYRDDKKPFFTKGRRFPDIDDNFLEEDLIKKLLLPNYWNANFNSPEHVLRVLKKLSKLVYSGICPYLNNEEDALKYAVGALDKLPAIRNILMKDVAAAYKRDQAARNYAVIIRTYPGLRAITIHRFAYELYRLGAGDYARGLAERIHTRTGIDVHPGAKIGKSFFIDHGTGTVIGETAEIGDNVLIYQGVTLGYYCYQEDDDGTWIKGKKRHPTIGNNVVIGAGTKIFGPVNIGNNLKIGANAWITKDIPSGGTVYIDPPELRQKNKEDSAG